MKEKKIKCRICGCKFDATSDLCSRLTHRRMHDVRFGMKSLNNPGFMKHVLRRLPRTNSAMGKVLLEYMLERPCVAKFRVLPTSDSKPNKFTTSLLSILRSRKKDASRRKCNVYIPEKKKSTRGLSLRCKICTKIFKSIREARLHYIQHATKSRINEEPRANSIEDKDQKPSDRNRYSAVDGGIIESDELPIPDEPENQPVISNHRHTMDMIVPAWPANGPKRNDDLSKAPDKPAVPRTSPWDVLIWNSTKDPNYTKTALITHCEADIEATLQSGAMHPELRRRQSARKSCSSKEHRVFGNRTSTKDKSSLRSPVGSVVESNVFYGVTAIAMDHTENIAWLALATADAPRSDSLQHQTPDGTQVGGTSENEVTTGKRKKRATARKSTWREPQNSNLQGISLEETCRCHVCGLLISSTTKGLHDHWKNECDKGRHEVIDLTGEP